jgi:hypothetical protein
MVNLARRKPAALALIVLLGSLVGYAADPKQVDPDQSLQGLADRSLEDLQRESNTLEGDIQNLQTEIHDLTIQHYWVSAKAKAEEDLKAAENKKVRESDLAPLRKALSDAASGVNTNLTAEDISKAIDQKQTELGGKRNRKDAIDAAIRRKVDLETPKQDFKKNISAYFAALIALVILGFFFIASRDEVVRREIFAGQAGIQFITLFALVIAIILFGITGILEGKELSALLGGLSGYILGRSTTTKSAEGKGPPEAPKEK